MFVGKWETTDGLTGHSTPVMQCHSTPRSFQPLNQAFHFNPTTTEMLSPYPDSSKELADRVFARHTSRAFRVDDLHTECVLCSWPLAYVDCICSIYVHPQYPRVVILLSIPCCHSAVHRIPTNYPWCPCLCAALCWEWPSSGWHSVFEQAITNIQIHQWRGNSITSALARYIHMMGSFES